MRPVALVAIVGLVGCAKHSENAAPAPLVPAPQPSAPSPTAADASEVNDGAIPNAADAEVPHEASGDGLEAAPEILNGTVLVVDGSWDLQHRFAQTVAGRLDTIKCQDGLICDGDHGKPGDDWWVPMWATRLTLNGRAVYRLACDAGRSPGCDATTAGWQMPVIVGRIGDLDPIETVIMVQAGFMGNGCENGPFFFMYVRQNGAIEYSKLLDMCDGKARIQRDGQIMRVRISGQSVNRGPTLPPRPRPDTIYTYDLVRRTLAKQN